MKEFEKLTVAAVEKKGKKNAVKIRCITLDRTFPSKAKLALFCAKYVVVRDQIKWNVEDYVRLVKHFETALCPCCWDRSKAKLVKGLLFEVCDD